MGAPAKTAASEGACFGGCSARKGLRVDRVMMSLPNLSRPCVAAEALHIFGLCNVMQCDAMRCR